MGKNTQQKAGDALLTSTGVIKKDPVSREFSSGGIVYRKINGEVNWLVAASAPSKLFPKTVWRLPKGWIDDSDIRGIPGPIARGERKATEEELQKAALREVREEGGIDAKIIQKIGTATIFFKHPERGLILKFVTYYLMEWRKDLEEGFDKETSEIAWLPYETAYKKLAYGGEKQIFKKASILLASVA